MISIRTATEADAANLLSIYRPHVVDTAVSFETELPTVEQFAARIKKILDGWIWLVAEEDGKCVGYAYGTLHRERAAFRWTTETSAYVHADHQHKGIGRALYIKLFEILRQKGYCTAIAVITLPNDASITLHQKLGFTTIGTFQRVGWKFNRWHDVIWMQYQLRELPPDLP